MSSKLVKNRNSSRDIAFNQSTVALEKHLEEAYPAITCLEDSFGCEDARTAIPHAVRKFLERKQMSNVLYVPINRTELTTESQVAKCHWNVERLVKSHGGRRIGGYCVAPGDTKGFYDFIQHAVWLNPNGTLEDVSPGNYPLDQTKIMFIPLVNEEGITCLFSDFFYLHGKYSGNKEHMVLAFLPGQLLVTLSKAGYMVIEGPDGSPVAAMHESKLRTGYLKQEGLTSIGGTKFSMAA